MILNQLEDYATTITSNENFDTKKCNWKFIAVSNELDKNAQSRINQDGKVVFGDKDQDIKNIEMYALTWAEVINLAETKLKFIQESLQYEANQDEVRDTLLKNYEAVLPPEFIAAKTVN